MSAVNVSFPKGRECGNQWQHKVANKSPFCKARRRHFFPNIGRNLPRIGLDSRGSSVSHSSIMKSDLPCSLIDLRHLAPVASNTKCAVRRSILLVFQSKQKDPACHLPGIIPVRSRAHNRTHTFITQHATVNTRAWVATKKQSKGHSHYLPVSLWRITQNFIVSILAC